MTVTIENTNVDTTLNIAELTTASLTGTGVFDVLLQTLRLHLDREFTSGRITGTAYATVYSQAITSFLQQAVGFCLSKAKLALELQQMQEQVTLLKKQQAQVESETSQNTYRTTYLLPEEVKITQYSQSKLLTEINKISNETIVTIKQAKLVEAQKIQTTAQTAQVTYTTSSVLPSQVALTNAQTAQVTYTTSSVLPAQVNLTNAQTSSATAQTALYNQKTTTELAQTTTTPASGSVMGVQNDLMATQKASYLRDAEQKAAKMLIDTWSVRRNAEPTSNPVSATNRLRDEDVGSAVDKMLDGIGVA